MWLTKDIKYYVYFIVIMYYLEFPKQYIKLLFCGQETQLREHVSKFGIKQSVDSRNMIKTPRLASFYQVVILYDRAKWLVFIT